MAKQKREYIPDYCHFVTDKETGQEVHIPGCWDGAIRGWEWCTCPDAKEVNKRHKKSREDELLNEIAELNEHIANLEQELDQLKHPTPNKT